MATTVNDTLLTPLWNYLKEFGNYVVGLLGKLTFVKTFVITACVALFEYLIDIVKGFLPSADVLTSYFNGIPPGVWYFCNLFALGTCAKLLLGAYTIKFLIRRIPFIG